MRSSRTRRRRSARLVVVGNRPTLSVNQEKHDPKTEALRAQFLSRLVAICVRYSAIRLMRLPHLMTIPAEIERSPRLHGRQKGAPFRC